MNNIRTKLVGAVIGASAVLALSAPMSTAMAQEEVFKAVNAIKVPGNKLASFDISYVDPVLNKYYLAERSNARIDVLPTGTTTPSFSSLGAGQFVGFTGNNDTSGPNGVITANNHKEVWAGDGPSANSNGTSTSKVIVINPATNTVTHRIDTGGVGRADELCEDPTDHIVLVANDVSDDLFITFVSTSTYQVLGKIFLNGTDANAKFVNATDGIEQCKWTSINDRFYLAIPEVNGDGNNTQPGVVLKINPTKRVVEQVFTVNYSQCVGPQGLAFGPGADIALGCSGQGGAPYSVAPGSVVINANTGATVYPVPGANGNDEVWYTPSINTFFFSGGNHTTITSTSSTLTPQLGVVDAATGQQDQSVPTAPGSHSVAGFQSTVYYPVNSSSGAQAKHLCSPFVGVDNKGCILIMQAGAEAD